MGHAFAAISNWFYCPKEEVILRSQISNFGICLPFQMGGLSVKGRGKLARICSFQELCSCLNIILNFGSDSKTTR